MKKIFALALVSMMTLPAFAQYDYDYSRGERHEDRRDRRGDHRRDERWDDRRDDRRGDRDVNVGAIIGGVIGAIIDSDRIDRDHSRRGYRGRVTCYAENRRGERFRARGHRPRFVQDDAIRACYNYGSRQCFALGCRTDRWN